MSPARNRRSNLTSYTRPAPTPDPIVEPEPAPVVEAAPAPELSAPEVVQAPAVVEPVAVVAPAQAAPVEAPARKAPTRNKVSFYISRENAARARGALINTPQEGARTFSEFIEAAVMKEVTRLEDAYNAGEPFTPVQAAQIPTGRPVRL